MRRVIGVYLFLICVFLMCITACEKENQKIEEDIPVAIKSDFIKRYPYAENMTFRDYSDGTSQIDFLDKEQNEASIWYVDETWKMTHTKIDDFRLLSSEAQNTFRNSKYGNAQILDIYKTERDGMEKSLYTLHFQYRMNKVDSVEHYVFINDDGNI